MFGISASIPIPTWWTWWFAACAQKSTIHSRRNSSRPFAALAMLSNRAEPRSIATQLVLLFTVCATLLLSCSFGLFYWIVVRHAIEEDNAVLADKAAAIRTAIKQPDGVNELAREVKNPRTAEANVYWIRVIAPDGNIVAETPGMSGLLTVAVFSTQSSTSSAQLPAEYRSGGKFFSLLSEIESADGQNYTMQIAQDRSSDARFRRQFSGLLALVLGLGVIASALIAITVTRRGLRPLSQMRRALERVRPAHLNERID